MKKSQAQKTLHELIKATENDTIANRSRMLIDSPYPELDTYLWEYVYGKIEPKEFEEKCIRLIQLSDTKLYQVLK